MAAKAQKSVDATLPLIMEFFRLLKSKMRKSIPTAHPSFPQLEVLDYIMQGGHPTMRDIAIYLKIKAPSATSLVEELVHEGFLRRIANPLDRRVVQLVMTEKGKNIFTRTIAERKKILSSLLLQLDSADIETFNHVLKKIVKQS